MRGSTTGNCGTTKTIPMPLKNSNYLNALMTSMAARYPRHAGLNQVLQQFCAHKLELLRVLDTPQLPLHTNAAETDLREYVTRRLH